MNIDIIKNEDSWFSKIDFDNLQFGGIFADHQASAIYEHGVWQNPQIIPFGYINILPSLCALHYGQTVFEGLKAFRRKDGKINIFRPDRHHARLNNSSKRLCIPDLPYDHFIESLKELVKVDYKWIPEKNGCSLYIRPFIFATDNFLGVKISDTYRFLIITSPVGSYYKEGLSPTSLMTSGEYIRAAKGGTGEAKTPGNYAASLLPLQIAKEKGFTQVLWLDSKENKYIDEIGTTNIFFVIGDELVTPPLDGTILNGVTRASVIEIANDLGLNVVEKQISIDEVFEYSEKGLLKEAFGTGTAAVISPVGKISHLDKNLVINNAQIGKISQKIYDEITAIQYGEKEDKFNWNLTV